MEKTILPQRYNNTQKSSHVRAYNRSFIIFAVTSVTVLQQHPNKQLVITIFGLKVFSFYPILHRKTPFPTLHFATYPSLFLHLCDTCDSKKSKTRLKCARIRTWKHLSTDFISKLICTLPWLQKKTLSRKDIDLQYRGIIQHTFFRRKCTFLSFYAYFALYLP